MFRSWHPRTRPDDVTAGEEVIWTDLTVLRTVAGGPEDEWGVVEFEASYTTSRGTGTVHESSRFERRRGTWVYVNADES